MRLTAVQRVLGLLMMVFSTSNLPPILVALWYRDGALQPFVVGFGATLALGFLIWLPVRRRKTELRLRDGFMVTALFWIVLGLVGAIPLYAAQVPLLGLTDAVFESMSGLTTTGATVLSGLDDLPRSILYYRQQLQWLGGMGIIVLAVAILPMLGVGGMALLRAETPGPVKDTKLAPRITQTAKYLWYIYVGLTLACALGYWWAGMTPFDAIGHSFSTVAIGGFSTHDASTGFFDSLRVEAVGIFFMVLAGANFALHFLVVRSRSLRPYWFDSEFRTYLRLLLVATVAVAVYLHSFRGYADWGRSFREAAFHVVSIGTTTGYAAVDFSAWPGFLPVLLIMMSFIGACAYSTGGGMKVIRWMLLYKQGLREVVRLIHPSAQVPLKLGGRPVQRHIMTSVWGFFSAYIAVFVSMLLAVVATGLDQVTAFSAVAACLNNLGPGLGEVAANYGSINDAAKWILVLAMLFGRLEVFTLLVILSPAFWER